jgi:hypothetical protein
MITPLMFTTAAVCELNVLLPFVAKFAHEDQGPLRLVAVQYMLSFGALIYQPCFTFRFHMTGLTPAALMAREHEICISALV